MPSQVRLSSDANDFKSKLQDCSFLERVLRFSCHVLADGFLVGFSFLLFMFLLPSFYIFIAVIIIDLIYTRSYFKGVFWLLDVTCERGEMEKREKKVSPVLFTFFLSVVIFHNQSVTLFNNDVHQ